MSTDMNFEAGFGILSSFSISEDPNWYGFQILIFWPPIYRGRAGELGSKRIETMEFLKYRLFPTTFFAFTFSSLRRLALETIRSPFTVLGNSVLNKRRKLHFWSVFMSRVHLPYQNSFSLGHWIFQAYSIHMSIGHPNSAHNHWGKV